MAIDYSKVHKLSYDQDRYRMPRLNQAFGSRAADSITPQDLERWLSTQIDGHNWKPATASRYKALLSLTFRLGVENGKITTNPAKLVRRRREDNGRIRWLTPEEETRLRRAIVRQYREHLPELEIALHTGLRRSEQYRLTWDCVNFDRRLLTIPRTKNGETRHISLNTAAAGALERLRRHSGGTGAVFVGANGQAAHTPRIWFEKAVRDAGLQDFTWHCLRHTFASRLVMAGVDLRTVQELMGHKTIQMTCRYAHLAPQHQLDAVERLCPTKPKPASSGSAPAPATGGTSPIPGPAARGSRLVN